ncbi:uncharacterized protein BDV17DRAFT_149910 [Aspergillus undulatus]|uniref:uncharacterized protein n=1 Tax=Aspergillus undulatus TaxID=1810928 RepID=UPI003CCC9462
MANCTIFNLPTEIFELIIGLLYLPDLLHLRAVCQSFRELIPPLSLEELLQEEVSKFGMSRNLYACGVCMCLRRRQNFADNMVKGRKAKCGTDAGRRFCLECGMNPFLGTARYTKGCYISMMGEQHVVCAFCGKLSLAEREGSVYFDECRPCRLESRFMARRGEA